MKITPADILAAKPCGAYDLSRITALFDGRASMTPTEIAELDIPAEDSLWALVVCVLDDRRRRLLACDCAERVQRAAGHEPNALSVNAIAVARRYAVGDATEAELSAARSAAMPAVGHVTAGASLDTIWNVASCVDIAEERTWQLARAGVRTGEHTGEHTRQSG